MEEGGCVELATGLAGSPNQKVKRGGRPVRLLQHAHWISTVTLNIESFLWRKKCTWIHWNNYLRSHADWYLRHTVHTSSQLTHTPHRRCCVWTNSNHDYVCILERKRKQREVEHRAVWIWCYFWSFSHPVIRLLLDIAAKIKMKK